MGTPFRVLILEDSPSDAELMLHALRTAGFDPTSDVVETESDFRDRLKKDPEIILADFTLPEFSALGAMQILRECALDIPVIIVSGSIGEERAVQIMQQGAADYLMKDTLVRLGQAVKQALEKSGYAREFARRTSSANLRNKACMNPGITTSHSRQRRSVHYFHFSRRHHPGIQPCCAANAGIHGG